MPSRILLIFGVIASLFLPRIASAQNVRLSVLPSATDSAIDRFDSVHTLYWNPAVKSRHELLLFLTGTGGKTLGPRDLCTLAADQGYHVICLMYPDEIPATVCWKDADKDAFTKFRLEIIEGGDKSPHIEVNRANCIENRLIKLLRYLKVNRPGEGWEQFLTLRADEPLWERLALAGQSQGGGHAALIATRHKVARVLMFSSPKDWSRHYDKPAAWYTPSVTPSSRYFAFVHEQDKQGCSWEQQLDIFKAMGLGKSVSVDDKKASFGKAHVLTTNYPGTEVTSLLAHTMIIGDGNTPRDAMGVPLFKPTWLYMLTAN